MSNDTVSVGNAPLAATFAAKDMPMLFGIGVGGAAAIVVFGVLGYWAVMRIKRRYSTSHALPFPHDGTGEQYEIWSLAFNDPRRRPKKTSQCQGQSQIQGTRTGDEDDRPTN
ncbi:hypothetical protein Aspvir_007047 [Aspergillus viridinutans]|uniref:Uncharacterized protein n=1 Tax=Aspergillus viridinutans TaxID=75553 RepID=A0A9P3F6G1_ASPVI|nr:uncharacterized protein Aspvir_007047 [Aspergillus viridinutans]GIK02981.1 hypothetical protein Aspvir_007047 [Aspergillus viridinutans]